LALSRAAVEQHRSHALTFWKFQSFASDEWFCRNCGWILGGAPSFSTESKLGTIRVLGRPHILQ